jgi:hypothetical protein
MHELQFANISGRKHSFGVSLEGLRKATKNVRTASVAAKIWTQQLLNTSYPCINPILFQNDRQSHPVIHHNFTISIPGFATMKNLHYHEDVGKIPFLAYCPYFDKNKIEACL